MSFSPGRDQFAFDFKSAGIPNETESNLGSSSGSDAHNRDGCGNLYSSAPYGGANGDGATFAITPTGTLTVSYSFAAMSAGGVNPNSGLTLGTDGNFYGTATYGGVNAGTVFKITPGGSLSALYQFVAGGSDGGYPYSPPIQGTDGNFYGTTSGYPGGYGTVYKITPGGKLTTLYSFDGTHGELPRAPPVQATDGSFYGTASDGGIDNDGVVYRITISGKFTVIYNFDGTHGAKPYGPLVQGSDGNLYGTTSGGGTAPGFGVIFKITTDGKLTILHDLNGTTDGSGPIAGLVQATDGNFYGANSGSGGGGNTIFRISPQKPYPYKVLYSFDGTTGAVPSVTLIQHTNGILYGDTPEGGNENWGTFYSLNVSLKPFVSLVSTSAKVGKTIEILGQSFKGTTAVSFNGTAATFKVVSGTYLTAIVPKGATTGFVTVTTPGGKLKSNKKFRVIS